jgi:signal transduction histidine kinase
VAQFHREFNRQGDVVVQRLQAIANSPAVSRMATALNRAPADTGPYFELAKSIAENNQLDFLEFVAGDGNIISSAQWPAKFGYPDESSATFPAACAQGAFLKQEPLPDGTALGLFAVRATSAGERSIYVIGGRLLNQTFLAGLDIPAGMRALLYQNRSQQFATDLFVDPANSLTVSSARAPRLEKLEPLVDSVRRSKQEQTALVRWSPDNVADEAEDEIFHAIPLLGAGTGANRPVLAILLIGNTRRPYVELLRHIRFSALMAGGGGILLAILLSSWAAARVTRPVDELALAAQQVAEGNWNVRVEIEGEDELALLAASFNRMTAELLAQRERLLQAERVAAWRELARRLAHELKNPLFPLQLTMETLVRARQNNPQQFEEIFQESSRTLLAEIANLKEIVSRFSEFSKMPQPRLRAVQINDVLRGVAQLFQAQLEATGSARIASEIQLDPHLEPIAADPELLHRAISNLVLNALDAMPNGGVLTLRTRDEDGKVVIEVTDTGVGLTREQCEQIFTPYYTSKAHGSGLGLAIVQSVVSDHGGRIRVHSEAGRGATFVIELPKNVDSTRMSG